MAKSEKIAYILEQVRLCLDKKDFVRAQVREWWGGGRGRAGRVGWLGREEGLCAHAGGGDGAGQGLDGRAVGG